MTFRKLMKRLGEPNPSVIRWAGCQHFTCDLPIQPHRRLLEIDGCRITASELGMAMYEIPVDEGAARILGRVHWDEEGGQTLHDVIAFRVESTGIQAGE
jgi:hypothetical protein